MATKLLYSLAVIGAIVYCALCAYFFFVQRNLLYFPTPIIDVPGAENLTIQSGGEQIHIWHNDTSRKNAIVYFGGNAEQVGYNLSEFEQAFPNYSIYLVNYRGYGRSSGAPTEAGLFADALAIYDAVSVKNDRVTVIGRSLGSGVASYLAEKRPVERLVLVTPYDSIASVAKGAFPWLPVNMLIRDRYDSISRAPQISCPVLLLVAEHDQIIPRKHSQQLFSAFKSEQRTMVILQDTNHNTISATPEPIRNFINRGP